MIKTEVKNKGIEIKDICNMSPYEKASSHLTTKEREKAEKEIGKEKIIQIDKVLKHAFSKINVYK